MAGIPGQPQPKPSSLNNPVPNVDAQAEADEFFANFKPPQVKAPAGSVEPAQPSAASAEADEYMAQFAPSVTDVSTSEVPGDASMGPEFAPEPGPVQANLEQFQNFTDRLATGLAANDTEKVNFLKQKYGDANARIVDGKIFFRKDPKGKFKRLDPATLEVVNDLIPDFAREIVQEVAMLPGEVGGGIMAGPAGAVGGRVASIPIANRAADALAGAAGVPQDPNRDLRAENMLGMGAETVLPFLSRFVKAGTKFVPGTKAYRVRQAENELAKADVALSRESEEILQAARDMDFQLFPHQFNPDNPIAVDNVNFVRNTPEFRNAQIQQGEILRTAVRENLDAVRGKVMPGPVSEKQLSAAVTDAARDLSRAEGRAIGDYKAKAIAKLGNQRVDFSPELTESVGGLARELGFKIQTKGDAIKFVPPKDLQPLLGKLGITDPGAMRGFVNSLDDVLQTSQGKGLKISDINRLVETVGTLNNAARRNGGQIAAEWGRLSSNLRQYRRFAIEQGLPDDLTKKAFNDTMDSFSNNRAAIDNIVESINTNMGASSVVKSMLGKGKESLGDVRALKQVLAKSYPDVWDKLRGEWVDQLAAKHMGPSGNKLNASAFAKDLGSYGKEFLAEMYEGSGSRPEDLMKLLTIGERIQKTSVKAGSLTEDAKQGLIRDTMKAWFASPYLRAQAVMGMLGFNTEKNVLRDVITKEGAEKYLTGLTKREREFAYKKLQEMQQVQGSVMSKLPRRVLERGAVNPAIQQSNERKQ